MVRRTYTETIDLNTEVGGPSILGLHTPIGGQVYDFLQPFFQAYKKYKYLGMDVTIVNSARLPYDPEQLGKVEGENYVDPRDSLNPILFKGCHGESLGAILNAMYEGLTSDAFKDAGMDRLDTAAALENFYYTALGDDAWRKSPVQKTLRIKGLHPLVYNLATNRQILPSNAMVPAQYHENDSRADAQQVSPLTAQVGRPSELVGDTARPFVVTPNQVWDPSDNTVKNRVAQSMFTNKCTKLGWMDTLQIAGGKTSGSPNFDARQIALLPKLFMGLLVLPPAYLTRNYLRVIIQHKFAFSGYRTITTGGASKNILLGPYGYQNHITGNVPGAEGNNKTVLMDEASVVGSEKADALGSETDAVDYDAIEEVDEDE